MNIDQNRCGQANGNCTRFGCRFLVKKTIGCIGIPILGFRLRPSSALSCLLLTVGLLLLVGCGRHSGPACYEISGLVTYNGQPVPAGYILFAPDKTKGNDGPGVNAEIRDGKYRTPAGQGVIGGPHTATINGYDGKKFQAGPISNPMGRPVAVPIQVALDLPKQASTHDFALPVNAKKIK